MEYPSFEKLLDFVIAERKEREAKDLLKKFDGVETRGELLEFREGVRSILYPARRNG